MDSEFNFLVFFIIVLILFVALIFIVGLIIDNYRKDNYKVRKHYYRTLNNSVGGGEEYYYRYWAWQPNKRKFYQNILLTQLGIQRTYTRKAMKKNKLEKSILPFRREIYGKAI